MRAVFTKAWDEYRVILAVAGTFLGILYIAAMQFGAHPMEIIANAKGTIRITVMMLITFLGLVVIWFFLRSFYISLRDGQGIPQAVARFNADTDKFFTPERIVTGLVGTVLYILMGLSISVGKSLIPYFNDYELDPLFSQMDKAIHGGMYPHELLVPFIDKMNLFGFVNFMYLLWFPVMFSANAWAIFCDNDKCRRMRFLWSSLLLWVFAGVIGASMASSVGPIYFSYFYPFLDDPYSAFVEHLRQVNNAIELNVVMVAGILLDFAMNGRVIDINAISAMPSMHVAIVTLIALYAFSYSRIAGVVCGLYVLMIMIGSVALGWHYAIDGYVSIILATATWFAAGRVLRSHE